MCYDYQHECHRTMTSHVLRIVLLCNTEIQYFVVRTARTTVEYGIVLCSTE